MLLDAAATTPVERAQAARCEGDAVELLRAALDVLPPAERAAFWHESILNEKDLAALRRSDPFRGLARGDGR